MRLTAFHTARDEGWSQFYTDLIPYGVLADVVIGTPSLSKLVGMVPAYKLPILAFQGAWAGPVIRAGNDRGWPVIGLCNDLVDWNAVAFEGLVRNVDLFVFRDAKLAERINRNVSHVVVAGPGDAGVLSAVLRNLLRHHPGQHPLFAKRTAERKKTLKTVQALATKVHGAEPSFLEAQFFVDSTHSVSEREDLVRKLPALLGARS